MLAMYIVKAFKYLRVISNIILIINNKNIYFLNKCHPRIHFTYFSRVIK